MNFPLNKNLDDNVKEFISSSISLSYKIKSLEITDEAIFVDFEEDVSEDTVNALIQKLLYISRSINRDILFDNCLQLNYAENPMQKLESNGEVRKVANGMYSIQGTFLKLLQFFNNYIKEVADKYNAVEQEYPILWPVELYRQINYFKEFPQQVILATTVKDNFEDRSKFADLYAGENDYDSIDIREHMGNSRYGLQSAVCDTCYFLLRNKTDHKNTVYTTYNKVFRNEYSKIDSLDRLVNFSVRDIMFVGDKDFVLLMRQRMIDEMIEFLKKFKLSSKIETANDPFFSNDSILKNVFQFTSRLKYELLSLLPFSNSYLAVGSINLHLDFFGRVFNIRLIDGTHAHSGCLGIGFERLVYALYSQYGPDTTLWPKGLRRELKLA